MVKQEEHDDIFMQLGLEHLPVEQKVEFLRKLEVVARDRVIMVILEELDAGQCDELDQLLKVGATEEDVLAFLNEQIEDLEQKVYTSIELFKDELIKTVKSLNDDMEKIQQQVREAPSADKKQVKQELSGMDAKFKKALKKGKFEDLPEIFKQAKQMKKKLKG